MVKKSRKKAKPSFWGLEAGSLLTQYMKVSAASGRRARAEVRMDKPKGLRQPIRVWDSEEEARIMVLPLVAEEVERDQALKATAETRLRDAMGPLILAVEKLDVTELEIDFIGPAAQLPSLANGLELALYRFRRVMNREVPKYKISLKAKGKPVASRSLEAGVALGQAINLARHLTNLPPNLLNPKTYAEFAAEFFAGRRGVKVEIWDVKRLRAEKMNLHVGVGRGSNRQPRLVRLSYRGAGKKPAVALVGKGITFDTGGLDIKPSSGMRLMKKDMGGSAAVLGAALWACEARAKCNLDVYLALAENSVSAKSFRPSDVIRARNGMTVEIHNTDAEGRLVLADALDVAVSAKPKYLVDVATLTGAIKVALGSGLAGLFGNNRSLVSALHKSGQQAGDLNWPMPLFQKYRPQLNSNFADIVNATDGFGGAVTAALFLERFVGDSPWAHLDIYAWKDATDGAWCEAGGSGQAVACLAEWLNGM